MTNSSILQYEYFSSVTQRKVEWLWYPYIPYGKITVIQGDPGEGKSTFILNVAALLTKGKAMPDGFRVSEPQKVIYQTAEDNLADTVKPRLLSAGADCNQVAYIVDDEGTLTLEDIRIEEIIRKTGARLFILDPLQAYLPQGSDMFNAGRMRQQLKRLADVAAKYRCAVVIIGHMNKASGEKNLYRGLGSIDIAAIARSVLMISRDKDDPNIRYMFPVKSSLAPEGAAIGFTFESHRGLKWIGTFDLDKEQIEECSIIGNKWAIATRFIGELLEDGDMRSSDMIHKLKILGISERTAQTAKKKMGVSSYKKDNVWFWHLNDRPDT